MAPSTEIAPAKGRRRMVHVGLVTMLLMATSLFTTRHVQRWLSFAGFHAPSIHAATLSQEKSSKPKVPSILDTVATWKANGQPFGRCGEGQNHTSLARTAERFSSADYTLFEFQPQAGDYFAKLTIEFQAVDLQGQFRTQGGDEFVLTLWVWTSTQRKDSSWVAYKQAAPATDLGNGSYRASFAVPQFGIERVKLSLLHFYSCYQGLGPHKPKEPFFKLPLGPHSGTNVTIAGLHEFLSEQRPPHAHDNQSTVDYLSELPYCGLSQKGFDDYTNGLWVENTPQVSLNQDEITFDAKWKSVACQPPPKKDDFDGGIRIGDSTMPMRNLEIGDAFHHYIEFGPNFNHHKRWVDYLSERLQLQQHQSANHHNHTNVLVFSGGLHQLYQRNRYGIGIHPVVRGYNVPTAVDLLIRMLCQVALVHPDRKLLLLGVGPIHQQIYELVDNTDHNVLWFNALLRQRIVEEHGGKLANICANVELSNLFSIPDNQGNAQNQSNARRAFDAFGYQEDPKEQKLRRTLSRLESAAGSYAYGNRAVAYADIHDILLARPECFKDKIHDHKLINYYGKDTSLHVRQHHVIIDALARMRGDMNDP